MIFCSQYSILDAVNRNHEYFKTNNGMPVLFLDSTSKYSRFSYSVNTGGLDDLKEFPGTSHLLEHVIFGVESPLLEFIYDHGGTIIACTEERCMFFEYIILNEYFAESLKYVFDTFNNPDLGLKPILKEIDLVEDEFTYRGRTASKIINIYTENDELNIFICGNKYTLLKEGIEEGLKKIHRENFLSYNGSIVCVTNKDRSIMKKYDIAYNNGPRLRETDFGLTDYYKYTERLFLVNSTLNLFRLAIQVPLQENILLISYLMDKYIRKLGEFDFIRALTHEIVSEYKFTVIKIHLEIEDGIVIDPSLLVPKIIEIIKKTKISIQNYTSTARYMLKAIKNQKPLDDREYSNVHKYIQFKSHMFEGKPTYDESIKFKSKDFVDLINSLIDEENYSFLYERPLKGTMQRSKYSKIYYINKKIEKRTKNSKNMKNPVTEIQKNKNNSRNRNIAGCSIQRNPGRNTKEYTSASRNSLENNVLDLTNEKQKTNSIFNPLDLIIFDVKQFEYDPIVINNTSLVPDYTRVDKDTNWKLHLIHLKEEKERRVFVFQFIVEPNYDNFIRLLYTMQSLRLTIGNIYTKEGGNEIAFELKHNMLEVIWTKYGYMHPRMLQVFCEKLASLIKNCQKNRHYIYKKADELIYEESTVIAEMVYGYTNLIRDFRMYIENIGDQCDNGYIIMPRFYLNLCLIGNIGSIYKNETSRMASLLEPSIPLSKTYSETSTFFNVTKYTEGYNTASLYIFCDEKASQIDYIVRLCCYLALYRTSETLRVKDKLGYYIVTDFTSKTYYSNFVMEAYSKKTQYNMQYILHSYIEYVVDSIINMEDKNFEVFLDVVYKTFKIGSNSIDELLHFHKSLDFKFDHQTFNEVLKTTLHGKDFKNLIVEMLRTQAKIEIR
ncbi:Coenzyme PQQ synthesis protein F [Nosema granulosis]|uniref:Coenzyme PQQ synthesis protein F n=1 Tax=Nosema granulosis TaxID=83296 RepID=A0A9P6GVV6_9MICR|nr:Coenzyme PQQ synthesis protein F [Nosema granulosis]